MAAMETDLTEKQVDYNQSYFRSGSRMLTCSNPISLDWGGKVHTLYSEVKSYRGKPQYVTVGNRRRRVFNPFSRWQHKSSTKDVWKLCNSEGTKSYFWGEYAASILLREQSRDLLTGTTELTGQPCLTCCLAGMQSIAKGKRDRVHRDLYVKARKPLFDTAVFLAELQETLVELKRILNAALRGWITAAPKARHNYPINNAPSIWLWYRYFLLPAMLDAENLVKAFRGQRPLNRVQDGFKDASFTPWIQGSLQVKKSDWPWIYDIDYKYRYKCSGGGALDISFRHDPNQWGLSAYDVLRATYERIPYSFVFDWFVDLSDYLSSWRDVEIKLAQSYSTIVVEGEYEIETMRPESVWHSLGDKYKGQTYFMERVVDIEPPISPLLDNDTMKGNRTLDAISLIIESIKGILQKRK